MSHSASLDLWTDSLHALLFVLDSLSFGDCVWQLGTKQKNVFASKAVPNGVNSTSIRNSIRKLLLCGL